MDYSKLTNEELLCEYADLWAERGCSPNIFTKEEKLKEEKMSSEILKRMKCECKV